MEPPCGTTISACQIGSPLCNALRSNTSATFKVLSSKFDGGLEGAELCGIFEFSFVDRDLDLDSFCFLLDVERFLEAERCLDLLFFLDRLLDGERFFPFGLDADRLDADRFLEPERFRDADFFLEPERGLEVSAFLDVSLFEESRALDAPRLSDDDRFFEAERRLEDERFRDASRLLEADRFPERERFFS